MQGVEDKLSVSDLLAGADERVCWLCVFCCFLVLRWGIDTDVSRELDKLAVRVTDYENLLRDLGTIVDGRAAERIRTVLEKVRDIPILTLDETNVSASPAKSLTPASTPITAAVAVKALSPVR